MQMLVWAFPPLSQGSSQAIRGPWKCSGAGGRRHRAVQGARTGSLCSHRVYTELNTAPSDAAAPAQHHDRSLLLRANSRRPAPPPTPLTTAHSHCAHAGFSEPTTLRGTLCPPVVPFPWVPPTALASRHLGQRPRRGLSSRICDTVLALSASHSGPPGRSRGF